MVSGLPVFRKVLVTILVSGPVLASWACAPLPQKKATSGTSSFGQMCAPWRKGTEVKKDEVVSVSGKFFQAIEAGTDKDPATDTTAWKSVKDCSGTTTDTGCPDWKAGVKYPEGAEISYNGGIFRVGHVDDATETPEAERPKVWEKIKECSSKGGDAKSCPAFVAGTKVAAGSTVSFKDMFFKANKDNEGLDPVANPTLFDKVPSCDGKMPTGTGMGSSSPTGSKPMNLPDPMTKTSDPAPQKPMSPPASPTPPPSSPTPPVVKPVPAPSPTPPPASPTPPPAPTPPASSGGDATKGKAIISGTCAGCHNATGLGAKVVLNASVIPKLDNTQMAPLNAYHSGFKASFEGDNRKDLEAGLKASN